MQPKPRNRWTPADALSVARLICDPATNGGQRADLAPEDVAASLPDAPAVAVFDGSRAVFVVGLWPYDASVPRGILHVAGTGEVRDAYRLVASFCDALPGVDVLTFTDRPALARLARRAGFVDAGEQGGYMVLRRANLQATG